MVDPIFRLWLKVIGSPPRAEICNGLDGPYSKRLTQQATRKRNKMEV